MPIGTTKPGRQTWPSRFDSAKWSHSRPRPNQLHIEYSQVSDILDYLCQDIPRLAIVGTRYPTAWGRRTIDLLMQEIRSWDVPVVIVSGVCNGCDEEAHRAAIRYGVPTIGVLPLLNFYRLRNLQQEIISNGGFMVSEFPQNTPWKKDGSLYLERDGITTALADVIIPIQATRRGGTWATINRAAAQSKPIWVPHPPQNEVHRNPEPFEGLFNQEQAIAKWFSLNETDLTELRTTLTRHLVKCP